MSVYLTLSDVARLAGVQRPVVSMWRQRPLAGMPFPAVDPSRGVEAEAVVSWLERTRRGNNPSPRLDLAAVVADRSPQALREHLLALAAAPALLDVDLTEISRSALLDAVDELDPDDEFLYAEVEAVPADDFRDLAAQASALADATWNAHGAVARLAASLPGTSPRLAPPLAAALARLASALLADGARVVDAGGLEQAVTLLPEQQREHVGVVAPSRRTRLLYRLAGPTPRVLHLDDDWGVTPGSVVLAHVDADGMDQLEVIADQLPTGAVALVLGPGALLTAPPSGGLERRRDDLLRAGLVRASLRLPQGGLADGSRAHLALWLMTRSEQRLPVFTGDLLGATPSPEVVAAFVDDVVAVADSSSARLRALAHLVPVPADRLVAHGLPLLPPGTVQAQVLADPGSDAARLRGLLASVPAPLTPWPAELETSTAAPHHTVTLGAAVQSGQVRKVAGTRLSRVGDGAVRLWTPETVGTRRPAGIDLLAATAAHPRLRLTEPSDVVVRLDPRPAAVVDRDGGAVVASPAFVLRSQHAALQPGAIAQAINRVPPGNRAWRTWPVTATVIAADAASDALARLDAWQAELDERQDQLEQLRLLVERSVLTGSVRLTIPTTKEGP